MENTRLLILIAAMLALAGCTHQNEYTTVYFPAHPDADVRAQMALSPQQQANGLMGRASLAGNEGMLFAYADERFLDFWMYHTQIPLDIVFISADGKVADVQEMAPCAGENASACRIHRSKVPARWALEVNAGFAQKHGIKNGDVVRIGTD